MIDNLLYSRDLQKKRKSKHSIRFIKSQIICKDPVKLVLTAVDTSKIQHVDIEGDNYSSKSSIGITVEGVAYWPVNRNDPCS